ncbi:hypothetical protein N7603_04975 [Acholeplasma vituli]|uniref:Uncharacterized protein n=1 Tax=Paracholeplasma vituli TaxID=69473 RepID=A0ABT2PXE7_9MOLU|nr:hypothetical protein [Paracholeplasma vituli]MCU0105004.1 hypothetical protein [Paracholeplasma vituli]
MILGVLIGHFLTIMTGKAIIRDLKCERIELQTNPISFLNDWAYYTFRIAIYNQSDKYATMGSIKLLLEKFDNTTIDIVLRSKTIDEFSGRSYYKDFTNLVLSPRQIFEKYFTFKIHFDDEDYFSLVSSIRSLKIEYLNDKDKKDTYLLSFRDFTDGIEVENL